MKKHLQAYAEVASHSGSLPDFPVPREQSPHYMPSSLQHPGSAPVIAIGVFLFNKPIPYILTESYPYIAFCYFKVYLTPLPAPVFFRIFFSIRLFRVRTALLFSISAAFSISDLDIFSFPLRMLTRYSSSLIPTGRGYSLEVLADEIYATLNGNEIDILKTLLYHTMKILTLVNFRTAPYIFLFRILLNISY